MKRQPKVLFVDDDLKVLEIFKEFFSYSKSPKIECITCSEPLEVEQLVKDNEFDSIFLDFQFDKSLTPEVNGIDVLNILNENILNLPNIFLLTGVADIPVAVDSIKHGASDVLIKPIDLEKVKKIVLECYFPNSESDINIEDKENDFSESKVRELDLNINDAINVNSLFKLDEIFHYIAKRLIDLNGELYIFANFYHRIEGFSTIFYMGKKSLSDMQIDEIMKDMTGKPRYKETKFINFSQINKKNDIKNLTKLSEFKSENNFFVVYGADKDLKEFSNAFKLFSTSLERIEGIEKSIRMMVEKVVEGSAMNFSNIMYKEV